MADNRRVNDSLTVEEFINRFTIISEDDIEALRNGEERVVNTTFGWVDQSDPQDPQYAYLNVIGEDDLDHLDELAYTNEDGELVIDYDDLSSSPVKDCTMAKAVVGQFPSGVRTSKRVKAVISLSEDEDGVEWLNVMEIVDMPNPEEAEEVEFTPEKTAKASAA